MAVEARAPSPFGPGNPDRPGLLYLFLRFVRHGLFAYGGPAAQLGHLHRELVDRDKWVSHERFGRLQALYQALPGPETVELAVYFGVRKGGRWGGLVAGLGFLLPGMACILLVAWLYTGPLPQYAWFPAALYGLRSIAIASLLRAIYRLGRAYLRTADLAAIALAGAAVALLLPKVLLVAVILAGGLAGLALAGLRGAVPLRPPRAAAGLPLLAVVGLPAVTGLLAVFAMASQAGWLSFGGAFTAVPFLKEAAVDRYGWLTAREFTDVLALMAMVPAPLAAEGVFIGFIAAGLPGALLAAVGVFLPAFALTLVGHRRVERLVDEPRVGAAVLGVTAAAIGLLAATMLEVAPTALLDPWTVAMAAGGLVALQLRAPNPVVYLTAAGLGVALHALGAPWLGG